MRPSDIKAIGLVVKDRVTVTWQSETLRAGVPESAQGIVEGDHGRYQVSYSPAGRVCACLAAQNGVDCSHAKALELAVLAEIEGVK